MKAAEDLLLTLLHGEQDTPEARALRHSQSPHGLSGDQVRLLLRAAAEETDEELRHCPEREPAVTTNA
jgi:hypothetical protein